MKLNPTIRHQLPRLLPDTGRALALSLLLVIAGCTSAPGLQGTSEPAPDTQTPEESSTEPESQTADDRPPPSRSTGQNATLALVQQSQRAEAAGSLTEAIAYAERAIRINPRAPDLWLRLAQLELTNGQPQSTIQYANKALSLIETRADWQRQAWLLIADAHSAMGEEAKADDIRARWRTYRG